MFYTLYNFGINGVEQQAEVLLSHSTAFKKLSRAVMRIFCVRGWALTQNVSKDMGVLGAFVNLRKATISFIMSVRPSVRVEQLGSHWTDFHEIRYLNTFRKSVVKKFFSLKCDTNNNNNRVTRRATGIATWPALGNCLPLLVWRRQTTNLQRYAPTLWAGYGQQSTRSTPKSTYASVGTAASTFWIRRSYIWT
jgi:hypothetical protein